MTNDKDRELIERLVLEVASGLSHPFDNELLLMDVVSIDTLSEFLKQGIARYLAERGKEADCELDRTAPKEIYLQISDDGSDFHQPFPRGSGVEITWCEQSVLDCEVRYVRADLTPQQPVTPEGMALVPTEPTREMLDWAHSDLVRDGEIDTMLRGVYRAMIAAAGSQP